MKYGRYKVIDEIGRGSMGVVYRAHDPNLDLTVALKVLRQDRMANTAFMKRFLSEAKALGRLDHSNIIRVYNVDEDDGNVYIAMEFIEGQPLNDVIRNKRFSAEEIIELGITVAESLDYAHQKGIVHRDIKPGNILISSDGRLKITDFGIAHIEDTSAPQQTQAGEILGTPAYMSPEQVVSRPVDGRSDIFSLGVILYELSTARTPFRGDNLAAIFNAITNVQPPAAAAENPDIPESLSGIISRCLQKNPDDRFESGKALADALKACTEKERFANTTPDRGKAPRKTVSMALAAVIAAIVIGLASYYFINSGTEPPVIKEEAVRNASFKIESSPARAQVFIDGTFKGKTPLTIKLHAGKHEVRLTSPDHYDWEAQVRLKEGGETPLFVRLIAEEKH